MKLTDLYIETKPFYTETVITERDVYKYEYRTIGILKLKLVFKNNSFIGLYCSGVTKKKT